MSRAESPADATPRTRFAELAARGDDELDLAYGAALIAAEEYPDLDPGQLLRRFDELAGPLKERLRGVEGARERLAGLGRYLKDELGLRGNLEDYYDPRNSFISDVLERRVGIPISLALVAMEVGQRAGVPLSGVAFPGHFLLRCDAGPPCFIDPFAPDVPLTAEDARALFVRLGGEPGDFDERFLRPVSPRTILVRMLRNLKLIYLKRDELEKAAGTMDRILMLQPADAREYRDRGIAYMKLEAWLLALPDLCRYLDEVPQAADRAAISAAIDYLKDQVASLN